MANTHSLDLEQSSSQYAYISDGSQTGLDLTSDFTIEAIIKTESTSSTYNPIVGKLNLSGNQYSYGFSINNAAGTRKLHLFISSDGSSISSASVNWEPVDGTFYRISCAYDASAGSVDFYVNGIQQGATQTGLSTSVYNSSSAVRLGSFQNYASNDYYFDGLIDDVRVWNDIRTPTEIKDNLFKELVGDEAGLVAYWKLNNDYTDETSNGNNLTASGSPVFSNDIAFSGSDNQLENCVDDDTVALWHCNGSVASAGKKDNAQGTSTFDFTEYNTPTSATGWDGSTDGAYDFDGSSSYCQSTGNVLSSQTSLTIGGWIYLDDTTGTDQFIIDTTGGGTGVVIRRNGSTIHGRWRFSVAGGDQNTSTGFSASTSQWYHVILTNNGTTSGKLYVNGVLIETLSFSGASGNFGTGALAIGTIRGGTASFATNCKIDEVFISNREFSSNEVMKYYGGIVSAKYRTRASSGNGAIDAEARNSGATYSTVRSAADGNAVDKTDTTYTVARTTLSAGTYYINRGYTTFPTKLPASCTVQKSSIYLAGSGDAVGNTDGVVLHCIAETISTDDDIATSDYDLFGSTSFGSITAANWVTTNGVYNEIKLNDTGLAEIQKSSAVTGFGWKTNLDIDNTTPTGENRFLSRSYDSASTVAPYIWIEYYSSSSVPVTVTPSVFNINLSVQAPSITGVSDTITPSVINVNLAIQAPTFIAPITITPSVIGINLIMQNNKSKNWSIELKSSLGSWSEQNKSSLGDWTSLNKS